MGLKENWQEAVQKKNSLLCVGIDPAETGQRPRGTLPEGTNKLDFCLELVDRVAPYAAGIKPNRQYLKDFSRQEMQTLNERIHAHGMISIDDSKLADIGDTNDAGFYHAAREGYDAVTYAPFPGNGLDAMERAAARGIGIISLVIMSNPEYQVIKEAVIDGMPGYEYFARQVANGGGDGVVIGAPAAGNHIREEEIRRVREIIGERLVLVPGIGAQGGDLAPVLKIFADLTIANVGRAIAFAADPATEAQKYRDLINGMRGQ